MLLLEEHLEKMPENRTMKLQYAAECEVRKIRAAFQQKGGIILILPIVKVQKLNP
jgi:hypothetical protein